MISHKAFLPDTGKAILKKSLLKMIFSHNDQIDIIIFFYLIHMVKILLVASHKKRDHAKLRLFKPRFDIQPDVLPFLLDVCSNKNMFYPKLGAHSGLISPSQISKHSPIV